VPVPAIQHGAQNNTFIYVVDTDSNTVSMQNVVVGTTSLDGSHAEITSGINEGDVVVTDGVDKLQNGSKIIITPNVPPSGSSDTPSTNAPSASAPTPGSS